MNKLQLAEIEEVQEVQQGFRVTDKGNAEWCVRKVQALNVQIAENNALASAEIERVKTWQESENRKAQDDINYFTGLLEQYMREIHEHDSKTRSIKLPHGVIRLKKQQPEFKMDEDKTLKWLKENYPDKVKVVEDFSKADVKKIVKETGEVWDGLEIIERDFKFEVVTE